MANVTLDFSTFQPVGKKSLRFKSPEVESEYQGIKPEYQQKLASLSVPSTITSGARDINENSLVGGVPHSKHLTGQAIDFRRDEYDAQRAKELEGLGFKPILESDHLHAEAVDAPETPVSLDFGTFQPLDSNSIESKSDNKSNSAWTGLRKFTQSATAGLSEPVAAGISAGITKAFPSQSQRELGEDQKSLDSLYQEFRGQQKEDLAKQEEDNPLAAMAGNMAGFLAPGAFSQIYKGAGKVVGKAAPILSKIPSKLAQKGIEGALRGGGAAAVYSGINPDEEITAGNVLLGAAAEPAGQLIGAGAQKLSAGLKKGAGKLMNRALGTTAKEIEKGRDIGPELVERGIFGTKGRLLKKAKQGLDANEAKLQEALSQSGNVNKQVILDELGGLKTELAKTPLNQNELDLVMDIATDPKFDSMTASQANEFKRDLYKRLNETDWLKETLPGKKEALKTLARGVKKSIEKVNPSAEAINKELGIYGQLKKKTIKKMSQDEARKGDILKRAILDSLGSALGFGVGGPVGMAAGGMGAELSRTTLGQSVGAAGMAKLGKSLKKVKGNKVLPIALGLTQNRRDNRK
jgi:hypothetical protein